MSTVYSNNSFQLPFTPSQIASVIAGSVAGASGVFIGHPFDSLKVRMQVGQALNYPKVDFYVIRQLYRGILPPLLTVGTLQAINFSNYEYFKRQIQYQTSAFTKQEQQSNKFSLATIFLAGTATGAIMSLVTTPMNIVKIRMQVASEAGIWACIKDVFHTGGIRTFYRGYWSAFFTEAPGRGVYMWIYEFTKLQVVKYRRPDYLHESGMSISDASYVDHRTRMIAAVSAGIFSWLAVYPIDVVKSKVQLDISKQLYRNSWDCIVKIWKYEGIRGFFRGLSYTLIRAGPVSATILPIYDITKDYVEKHLTSS